MKLAYQIAIQGMIDRTGRGKTARYAGDHCVKGGDSYEISMLGRR